MKLQKQSEREILLAIKRGDELYDLYQNKKKEIPNDFLLELDERIQARKPHTLTTDNIF